MTITNKYLIKIDVDSNELLLEYTSKPINLLICYSKFTDNQKVDFLYKAKKKYIKFLSKNGIDFNVQNEDTYTALYCACFFNKSRRAKLLIKYGANITTNVLRYLILKGVIK